jgi:NADPH-dependent 2,4-dienoyl-CoA reductase/sulfur reductase-like enzyme
VNPALGHEEVATLVPTASARQVVVVGGGPAGMEAARVLTARGHRAVIIDKADRLGGTAWFSQLTTPANQQLVEWLVHEIHEAGVEVRLDTEATVELLQSLHPDAVVVATGAARDRLAVPGGDLAHVRSGDEMRALITGAPGAAPRSLVQRAALSVGRALHLTEDPEQIRSLSKRWMPVGSRVVVIGGGLVGLELAEFLAERGRHVTVLESGKNLGLPMAMPRRWRAVGRATEHGVVLVRSAEVLEITAKVVRYRVGDETAEVAADDVIVASEVRSDDHLARELSAAGIEVHLIGDAASVGYIEGAMHSAFAVATAL